MFEVCLLPMGSACSTLVIVLVVAAVAATAIDIST